jgi:hypothetical protein
MKAAYTLRAVAALPSEGHGHSRAGNCSCCVRTDLLNDREAEQAMQFDQSIVETNR